MEDGLLGEVYVRLDAADLDPELGALIMAACEDQLTDVLGGEVPTRRELEAAALADPVGAYLSSITVEGFRGVGRRRSLKLAPGPGLTVVVGRNGSGKSSFAEAVEVVLTGTSSRWEAAQSTVWREGWRNLHDGQPKLAIEITEEGSTTSTIIDRTWPDPDDLASGATRVRRAGGDPEPFEVLGWQTALTEHRPILSYHELGTMLQGKPSALHDALAGILGVEGLTAAITRVVESRKLHDQPAKDVKGGRRGLMDRLEACEDPRAQTVLDALSTRKPDLDTAELHLLDDAEVSEGAIATLRRVAALELPSPTEIDDAATAIEDAKKDVDRTAGTDAGRAKQVADLLGRALAVHQPGEEQPCPVCQEGQLDDAWRQDATTQIEALTAEAEEAEQATRQLTAATATARRLAHQVPDCLDSSTATGLDASMIHEAMAAWSVWAAQPEDTQALAGHLRDTHPTAVETLKRVTAAAQEELDRRHATWRPVAAAVQTWIDDARAAEESTRVGKKLKKVEVWLKDCQTAIKNDRFEPVRDETVDLWSSLRLASNVEVNNIELTGSSTRRSVHLDVTVDGSEANALGVMSQGELHALALSIFIPRATRPESPFRFLLIDDPVQSMDPARVDGLARVLHKVAERRQILVFTHDDRLPESLRRLRLGGRIVGVTRQEGSVVNVKTESDPVARAISDAKTLAKSHELSLAIRNRLVPGFLRVALEAACAERYTREALQSGVAHRDIESALIDGSTLRSHVGLALEQTPNPSNYKGRLDRWDTRYGPHVEWVNKASHGSTGTELGEEELWSEVHVTRDLAEKLQGR